MFSSSSRPLFLHFNDLSTYIAAIFNIPHVTNKLQTVRFLFTVVHAMLAMYKKLEWLVNHILLFSQSACICNTRNVYKLTSSEGLAKAHLNYHFITSVITLCKQIFGKSLNNDLIT